MRSKAEDDKDMIQVFYKMIHKQVAIPYQLAIYTMFNLSLLPLFKYNEFFPLLCNKNSSFFSEHYTAVDQLIIICRNSQLSILNSI